MSNTQLLENLKKLQAKKNMDHREFAKYLEIHYERWTQIANYGTSMGPQMEKHWRVFTTKIIPDLLRMNIHVCDVPHRRSPITILKTP